MNRIRYVVRKSIAPIPARSVQVGFRSGIKECFLTSGFSPNTFTLLDSGAKAMKNFFYLPRPKGSGQIKNTGTASVYELSA